MNDKELINKLGELKEIKAPKTWKEETRSFLLSEVKSSVIEVKELSFLEKLATGPKFVFSVAHQQAWAVVAIFLIVIGGGFSTQVASKNAKPGDSLYLARVLSEKAKVAVTFNKEEKAKLDMQLASNRAKEINDVLSGMNIGDEQNKKKAEKLSESFKEEVKIVKKNIEEIRVIREDVVQSEQKFSEDHDVDLAQDSEEEASFGIGFSGDAKVMVSEAEKTDKAVEVYIPEDEQETEEEVVAVAEAETSVIDQSTSSETAASTSMAVNEPSNMDQLLDNAQESLDAQNFELVKEMFVLVDQIINDGVVDDLGEVKGVATTSQASSENDISEASSVSTD